jgi:hypothetical protein
MSGEQRSWPPDAAEKTQATLDAINNGTLTLGPDDVSFWTLKAADDRNHREEVRNDAL